jgi:hypothetical protein
LGQIGGEQAFLGALVRNETEKRNFGAALPTRLDRVAIMV